MTPEDAEKLGYIKLIDYQRTMHILAYNMAIIDHATTEIKASKQIFEYKTILIGNFAFLLRAMVYHIILVSLELEPGITIFMLLVVELTYITLIIWNFFKLKYLISIHLFFSKFI
jgi:hypothetical protein